MDQITHNLLCEIRSNSNSTSTILESILEVLESLNTNLNDNPVRLEAICALVDGVATTITPVIVVRDSQVINKFYIDYAGETITGAIDLNVSACECLKDCPNCNINGFDITNAINIDTKINYDDPSFTNAFTDITAPWTAQDLVNLLNSVSQPAPYAGTVWQVSPTNPNVIQVVSGATPTTINFINVPLNVSYQ